MRYFIPKAAAIVLLAIAVVAVQGDKCYYKSRFLFMTASEDCGSDGFCCGSCDDRYCCKDPSQAINQTDCATCSAYTDIFGEVQPAVECDPSQGLYCCGTCYSRYCCKRLSRSLDQNICWNNYVEAATTTGATTTVVTQTDTQVDPNDDNDFNYGPFMDTTQPPFETTTNGYWYFPKPHYTYFTNPSYLWLKILIIIIPFAALVFLIIYIAVWNRQRIMVRLQQQQQQQALNKQRPARVTRVQMPQPTSNTTNVATIEAAASTTNIQDIHTMYNDDLSLVPNYDSVKNQAAPPSSRTVQGPFIYPSTEDLPNYSNLNQQNK